MIRDEVGEKRLRKAARAYKQRLDQIYRFQSKELRHRHLHILLGEFLDRAVEQLLSEGVIEVEDSVPAARSKLKSALVKILEEEFGVSLDPGKL